MPCLRGHDNESHQRTGLFSSLPKYAPDLIIYPTAIVAQLEFDLANRKVDCEVNLKFRAKAKSKCIRLDAVNFLNVSVEGIAVKHEYDGGKSISLIWEKEFEVGEERNVKVKYTVIKPVSGLFITDEWAISDNETEKCRYWLPCIDFPVSRTTMEFHLISDEEMVALANGKLVKQEHFVINNKKKKLTIWKLDSLCPSYLACVAVGYFREVVDGDYKYFAPMKYSAEDIYRSFDKTPKMVEWIQAKLGVKFPWPKYYQIACSSIPGAMENISLVTWSDKYLMDEKLALERKHAMDTVNVHEMAHTYFGNLVVINHFEHVWMKESWATYMESVWIEDHLSKDEFVYEMFCNAEDYFKETEEYIRPIVCRNYKSSWSLFDSHTYPGGCWRIHMLRNVVGNECFWKCVTIYLQKYSGKTVETDDFRKILEEFSGINLTRFFDEWFFSEGYPVIKATYGYDNDRKRVEISFEQVIDKEKGQNTFHLNMDVEIVDEKNITYRTTVPIKNKYAQCSIAVENSPSQLLIDPDCRLLFKIECDPGVNILAKTAGSARDVVNRIRSYRQLIKSGMYPAMQQVQQLVRLEKFYGVRVQVANALYKSKTNLAVDILSNMLLSEKHPMAMWQIAKCCQIRDERLRTALIKVLEDPSLPYKARASALESLGYQRNITDLEILTSTISSDYHDIVSCGAIRGISNIGGDSKHSFNILKSKLETNPSRNIKIALLQGLTNAALKQDNKFYVEECVEILKDNAVRGSDDATRKAAVSALVQTGVDVSSDIWESRVCYATQDITWLECQIDKMKTKGTEWKLRVEELEGRIRELEKKVSNC